jgi:septum formation protein
MTTPTALILASTSPHRRMLLERLQLPFRCVAPQVAEDEIPGEPPPDRAARLALAKARAVAAQVPGAIVIGSDQVASLEAGGRIQVLHNPGSRENCHRQLAALSGQSARFHTAVTLLRAGQQISHTDLTLVNFRSLDDAAIEAYMDREPSCDCAGGFKIEGLGVSLFERVESHDPTALVGLPLIAVCAALRQLGVRV